MMTDSATIFRRFEAPPSKTNLSRTSATSSSLSDWPTDVERLARSRMVLPTSLSEALWSRMMGRKTESTRGMLCAWLSGHWATMFAHRATAEPTSGRCSVVSVAKILVRTPITRAKDLSTLWLPTSELSERSPRKSQATLASLTSPSSIRPTEASMTPLPTATWMNLSFVSGGRRGGWIERARRHKASPLLMLPTSGLQMTSTSPRRQTSVGSFSSGAHLRMSTWMTSSSTAASSGALALNSAFSHRSCMWRHLRLSG
mmetsp:Transcript_34994/g.98220  ORF Transcript_34994/g.98220 Transcript_34994/m.98220 type:complete len:258 (-) Transcript_34994:76-849(-)